MPKRRKSSSSSASGDDGSPSADAGAILKAADMAKRAKSQAIAEGFSQAPTLAKPDGFSALSFSQNDLAAQVAAAKAQADQMMHAMGMKQDARSGPKLMMEAQETREVKVRKEIVKFVMTDEHRQLLMQDSGAEVEWKPESARVKLSGGSKQISAGARILARVDLHCHWGANEEKVRRLLRKRNLHSVMCRLSPMTVNQLTLVEKQLSAKEPNLRIGKDKNNEVVIMDPVLSRQHCLITLDAPKGAVYIADLSTNGTFLNGTRLPSKKLGKVFLSHGDEILLKDPNAGDAEFGYICNLQEISGDAEVDYGSMRRILTPEESSITRGVGGL